MWRGSGADRTPGASTGQQPGGDDSSCRPQPLEGPKLSPWERLGAVMARGPEPGALDAGPAASAGTASFRGAREREEGPGTRGGPGGSRDRPGEAACDASPAAELTVRRAGCVRSQDPSRAPGPKASAAARLPSEGPGGRRGGRSAPWGTGQRGTGGEGESCAQWPGDCRGHSRTRVGPPRGRDAATETPTTRKHLENGLMMFYNRNELYSYS